MRTNIAGAVRVRDRLREGAIAAARAPIWLSNIGPSRRGQPYIALPALLSNHWQSTLPIKIANGVLPCKMLQQERINDALGNRYVPGYGILRSRFRSDLEMRLRGYDGLYSIICPASPADDE